VVTPGAVILELLPVNEEPVIEGRVNPTDISHVKECPDALVRLTALNQRLTPAIAVAYVSADAIVEQHGKLGKFHPLPACRTTSTSTRASARASSTCCDRCSTTSRPLFASIE
jgi:hypothetical protein